MIVIGVDVHKRTHTLAAVDGITGRQIAELEVKATDAGHLDALRLGATLGVEVVWAIEDCRTAATDSPRAGQVLEPWESRAQLARRSPRINSSEALFRCHKAT